MQGSTPARVPSCTIQTLAPLVRTLRSLDIDLEPVLARAGLLPEQLHDAELRIPVEQSRRFLECAYDAADDPALGLRMVEQIEPSAHSLFTYLSASSATPREAYARAVRYVRVAHDAVEIDLRVEGNQTICRTSVRGFPRSRTEAEFSVGLMVKLAPKVVDSTTVRSVWFVHEAPEYADEYDRVFDCAVRFGAPCDAIIGLATGLDAPLPRADSDLCALIEAHAEQQLAKLPPVGNFADTVRQRIAATLRDGDPSSESIARGLGMSSRTLRRRLQECDTSHQQLLDEVRCELAIPALDQRGVSVNEVAYLLGFSDASAFHKAFRRWTGQGPGAYLSERRGPSG